MKETAEVLKISPETVMRDWKFAKVWLLRRIEPLRAICRGALAQIDEIFTGR